jgi:hypothetical protein
MVAHESFNKSEEGKGCSHFVVVTCSQIDHDVLVPLRTWVEVTQLPGASVFQRTPSAGPTHVKEHDTAMIIKLIHPIKVGHLRNIHHVNHGKIPNTLTNAV